MPEEFSEETGFDGYQPITVDPGPSILIATIAVCFFSLAIIPCLVSRQRRRIERRSIADKEQGPANGPDEQSVGSSTGAAQDVLNTILDGTPHSGPNKRRNRALMEKYHDRLRAQDPSGYLESNGRRKSRVKNIRDSIKNAVSTSNHNSQVQGRERSLGESIANSFNSLLEIGEWDYEMKRICRLATPFVTRGLAGGVLEAVNVALIARLIGTRDVAAYVTVDMIVILSASVFSGFYESLATLCSQAIGARNKHLAGQYVQMSIILTVLCSVPMIVVWMYCMEGALRWFGFAEYTVRVGNEFSRIYLFVIMLEATSKSIFSLLDTIGKETYSGLMEASGEVAATIGVVIVALSPNASIERVGIAMLIVAVGETLVNVSIISWKGWFDPYLGGLIGTVSLKNGKNLRLMLKTSASLSMGYLLSYSEWEFLALFSQTLGPAEVTAWNLLGTLWDIVEMVSEAVADAAEVRCANMLGASRHERAKLSAYKSIYLATFVSLCLSSIIFIFGDQLPIWITKDATLQHMLLDLIPLFGIGNAALTLGTMAWTIVGSQGRYRLATAVGFAGSWFVTMPLAALFTIALKMDLRGQTAAVVIGYMVSGTANCYLLFTSDWEDLSRKVVEANAEISSSSSEPSTLPGAQQEVVQIATTNADTESKPNGK